MRNVVLALTLLGTTLCQTGAAEDAGYLVIVHAENPTTVLPSSEISAYLLKKKHQWPHGAAVSPVNLGEGTPVREAFSRGVHRRSTEKVETYWQRQIFSGRSVPPPALASEAEVVAYVGSHVGAIGYVSPSVSLDGVKVLDVATSPKAVATKTPGYTSLARRQKEEGVVALRLTIDKTAEVTDVEVLRKLRFGLTDKAVIAIREWKFEPARVNGEPVDGTLDVNIEFGLD